MGFICPKEAFPQAKSAIDRALELDDMLAEAHSFLGYYKLLYEWDFNESEKEFKRAFAINPNYAPAHLFYSILLISIGKFDEAFAETERVRKLDPLSVFLNAAVGWIYTLAQRYDEAMEHYRWVLEMDPHFPTVYAYLGVHYCGQKMWDKAITAFNTCLPLWTDNPMVMGYLGYAYASAGLKDMAFDSLARLEKLSKERYVSPLYNALIYIGLDDKDRAFDYFDKGCAERESSLIALKGYPFYDGLWDDPRFIAILKKHGLPE
jgi:tetratricopeptide (TPR) repeat protein